VAYQPQAAAAIGINGGMADVFMTWLSMAKACRRRKYRKSSASNSNQQSRQWQYLACEKAAKRRNDISIGSETLISSIKQRQKKRGEIESINRRKMAAK